MAPAQGWHAKSWSVPHFCSRMPCHRLTSILFLWTFSHSTNQNDELTLIVAGRGAKKAKLPLFSKYISEKCFHFHRPKEGGGEIVPSAFFQHILILKIRKIFYAKALFTLTSALKLKKFSIKNLWTAFWPVQSRVRVKCYLTKST